MHSEHSMHLTEIPESLDNAVNVYMVVKIKYVQYILALKRFPQEIVKNEPDVLLDFFLTKKALECDKLVITTSEVGRW